MEQLSNKRALVRAKALSVPEGLEAARQLTKSKAGFAAGYRVNDSGVAKPTRHRDSFLSRLGLGSIWRRADTAPSDMAEPRGNAQHSVEATTGTDIRNWVLQWARLTENGNCISSEVKFPATPNEKSDDQSHHPIEVVTLEIDGIRISGNLDLRGINAPHISIILTNVTIDHIDFDNSHFADFVCRKINDADWFFSLSCRNAELKNLVIRSADIMHVDAHGVRCETIGIFNVRFLGGALLSWLNAEGINELYDELFSKYTRSVDVTNAIIEKVVLYQCVFTSIVSFRDARVQDSLKLEECHFIGHNLPRNADGGALQGKKKNSNELNDVYDWDDLLAGSNSVDGLTLDVSRADLGVLCVRAIDGGSTSNDETKNDNRYCVTLPGSGEKVCSRGWMNFANARAKVLDMDFAYWEKKMLSNTRIDAHALRHRLSGFNYGSLHVLSIGDVSAAKSPGTGSPKFDEKNQDKGRPTGSRDFFGRGQSRKRLESWKSVRAWLQAQLEGDLTENFQAQPWTIAAKTFHAAGDFRQANELLMTRDRLAHESLWHKRHIGRWFLELPNRIHGFGNRLWLPIVLMLALWVCGALFYQHSFNSGYFLPNPASGGIEQMSAGSDKSKLRKYPDATYPKFNAWIYSLDVMIPVVHFSQETYWVPGYGTRDAEQRDNVAAPEENRSLLERVTSRREGDGDGLLRLWIFYWAQIIFGYMGTVVIGLGFVGYLERRPPA